VDGCAEYDGSLGYFDGRRQLGGDSTHCHADSIDPPTTRVPTGRRAVTWRDVTSSNERRLERVLSTGGKTLTDQERRQVNVGWTVSIGCGEGCPLPNPGAGSGDTI